MVPEKDQNLDDDDKPSDDDLPKTSYATIQKPEVADENEDQHLRIWGRFWGVSENLAVAFLINLNFEGYRFIDEKYHLYEEPDQLIPFDPDQGFSRFKRTFEKHSANPNIPNATLEKVKTSFQNYLESSETKENLVECFRTKDREQFSEHAYEIKSRVIPKGEVIHQFMAELSTPDSAGGGSSTKTQGSSGQDETENSSEDNVNSVPVTPVASPMKGDFPEDLDVGDTVFVRTTGEVTKNLSDELQSDEDEEYSVPLKSTVRSISSDVDSLENFDGNENDYWELTVNFLEDQTGECFIHKNTQIKTSDANEDTDQGHLLSPFVLITTGIILLVLLGLAYVIFGL